VTDSLVRVGIVGLGRWAKVLTKAASKSEKIKIVAGYSRSEEKRQDFQAETGVPSASTIEALLGGA
jgi:predicted dehydrogenase